jgi:N-methylhydantoinase B
VDFTGTSEQRQGSINAVHAIALSAVYYVFRCLLNSDVPGNSGFMKPIKVLAPEGSLVNAQAPAAVAAGNVETSQRIVDVLLGALSQVFPDRIPAASQGTMNNLTIGGWDAERERPFAYYETIAGGAGATPQQAGASAIHTHMTNTLNTPIEAIEYEFPFLVTRYSIRANSGGAGSYVGGDGVVRQIELLSDAVVTILSDRRRFAPYGLGGGHGGKTGQNLLIRGDEREELPGKISRKLRGGDRIRIETPGGGGHN